MPKVMEATQGASLHDNVSQLDAARREENKHFLKFRDDWIKQVICDRGAKASHCVGVMVGLQYLNRSTYQAWPGGARIAKDLGLSERQVKRAFQELVKRGHLIIATAGGGRLNGGHGKGRANVYKPIRKRPSDTVTDTTEKPGKGTEYGDTDDTVSGRYGDMDGQDTVTCMSPHLLNDLLDKSNLPDQDVCEGKQAAKGCDNNLKAQTGSKEEKGAFSGGQASPPRASKPKAHGLTDAQMFELFWAWFPRRAPSASIVQARDAWDALSEAERCQALSRLGSYRVQVSLENPFYRTPHPRTYLADYLFDGLPDAQFPGPFDWKRIEQGFEATAEAIRTGKRDQTLGADFDHFALYVLALIASDHVKTGKVIRGFYDLQHLVNKRAAVLAEGGRQ